jgi:hemin uptake protein HemP
MQTAELQDTGRTITRRRHVIVARKRPAGIEHAANATPMAAPAPEPASTAVVGDIRVMTSEQLFAGQNAVDIHHTGAVYTLRVTRFGKLILTK